MTLRANSVDDDEVQLYYNECENIPRQTLDDDQLNGNVSSLSLRMHTSWWMSVDGRAAGDVVVVLQAIQRHIDVNSFECAQSTMSFVSTFCLHLQQFCWHRQEFCIHKHLTNWVRYVIL